MLHAFELRILHGGYESTQLYLRSGFSLPAQVSFFFFICMGDSADAGCQSLLLARKIRMAKTVLVEL